MIHRQLICNKMTKFSTLEVINCGPRFLFHLADKTFSCFPALVYSCKLQRAGKYGKVHDKRSDLVFFFLQSSGTISLIRVKLLSGKAISFFFSRLVFLGIGNLKSRL